MQKLNSFEELKAKRDALLGDIGQEKTEVRVAMATCAIATGAKDVYDALAGIIGEHPEWHATLKSTGCMGYCYAEPTVEVVREGEAPVVYGHMDAAAALSIIEAHLGRGVVADDHVVKTCHVNL